MGRAKKQLARDKKVVRASSSSSSSVHSLGGRARRLAREKLLRQIDAEGPVFKARLVLKRNTAKDVVAEERAKIAARKKIAKALRAKLLRKRIALRVAQHRLRAEKAREAAVKSKLRKLGEKAAARKIVRKLRQVVSRRRKAAAAVSSARESARAARIAVAMSASSSSSNGGGGHGVGAAAALASAGGAGVDTSMARRVLAKAVARRMGARKARMFRRGGLRCPKGSRRIRRTNFCGTKTLIAVLPRLPRRRPRSPAPGAPAEIQLDTARHCPKGYRRLVKRKDGKRVRKETCRRR